MDPFLAFAGHDRECRDNIRKIVADKRAWARLYLDRRAVFGLRDFGQRFEAGRDPLISTRLASRASMGVAWYPT